MVPAPALGFRWVLVPGAKRAERTELTADWMIDHARSKSCWPRSRRYRSRSSRAAAAVRAWSSGAFLHRATGSRSVASHNLERTSGPMERFHRADPRQRDQKIDFSKGNFNEARAAM